MHLVDGVGSFVKTDVANEITSEKVSHIKRMSPGRLLSVNVLPLPMNTGNDSGVAVHWGEVVSEADLGVAWLVT